MTTWTKGVEICGNMKTINQIGRGMFIVAKYIANT